MVKMFAPGITVASVVILWFLGSASATKVALQHDDLGSDLSSFVTVSGRGPRPFLVSRTCNSPLSETRHPGPSLERDQV